MTAEDHARNGDFAYTEDFHEATRAFLEKRKPVFRAR